MTQRQRKHKFNRDRTVFDYLCYVFKKRNPNGNGYIWKAVSL